jgi:hypothetical protein
LIWQLREIHLESLTLMCWYTPLIPRWALPLELSTISFKMFPAHSLRGLEHKWHNFSPLNDIFIYFLLLFILLYHFSDDFSGTEGWFMAFVSIFCKSVCSNSCTKWLNTLFC